MKRSVLGLVVVLATLAIASISFAQKPAAPGRPSATKAEAKPTAPQNTRAADEKTIRLAAEAYAKAYNAHDPQAIAALFTPEAEIVDETGDAIQGRTEIEAVFTAVFEEYPEATTAVEISSVRFLSPVLAVEDGITSVVHEPGQPAERNRYSVLHIKQDNKWLMASARDLPEEQAAPEAKLKALEWLIGDWVDESADAMIVTTYRWNDNQTFILSDFSVQVEGRPLLNGSQRIGWDPLAKTIRSWVFDSEGGFAEGIYSQDGDRWIIKLTGVTNDGEPASATNTLTRISKDRMSWQSRDRTVSGRATPDIEAVTVAREPPKPE